MRRLAPLALAVLPFQALAQEPPLCGGIAQVGEWLGGSEQASDPAASDAALDAEGVVPIAGHLVRMFTLAAETELRVEVAPAAEGDPFFAVVDAAGAEVAADDDSGGALAARAEVTLGPGTYCVAARSYTGLTPVAMRIGLISHAPLTDGAAPAAPPPAAEGAGCGTPEVAVLGEDLTAAALAAGVTLSGSASEAPGRAFTLAEALPLTITATGEAADPTIRLLDADGAQLAENDDADGLNSRIDVTTPLDPGAYCVEMGDLNDSAGPIALTLRAFDAEADRLARMDRAEMAPTPQDPVPVADLGTVDTTALRDVQATGRAQWLRFALPEGGLLVAEAIAGDVDPTIRLFDRVGRLVGENDDGPQGLDSFLAVRVTAGEYLLAVRLVDESSTGPVRVLVERFVPAR